MGKIFKTTKNAPKILERRNTHEKKFWTHEIPKRNNFGPAKYSREKNLDPQNTPEGALTRWHQTHGTHNGRQRTKFSTLKSAEISLLP